MSIAMQKQTARNLIISANAQAAYGGVLADANLSRATSIDPSTSFSPTMKRYSDIGSVGHGTDYATGDVQTAWGVEGMVKGMGAVDAWMLGWMMAFICGADTVSGAGPYTHLFSLPMNTALAPCTTVYVEDTADVHRKYTDLSAKSLSIDIPERGPIQASCDFVGTGKFFPGSFGIALPAPVQPTYLLGSDVEVSFTPSGGALTSFIGRQKGVSIKIDRGTAPFESSGDGLTAGSNQYGKLKFSVDLTVMAKSNDDVNGWFESMQSGSLSVFTSPGLAQQLIFSFPLVRMKTNKLGNENDLVAWKISFDETSMLQNGAAPALSPSIINTCPAYLVPA
jgi:hypothetical protein